MITFYAYSCLLSALTVVGVTSLNIKGHVGQNVTIKCSYWNTFTDVKSNVKYFCEAPCSTDKHIIVKAAIGQTKHRNGIQIVNSAAGAFVTFTNLQKSDSKRYYCGVERFGRDALIEVNLKVTDGPKTTPKAFDVTSSTVSSSSTDIIPDTSTSYIIHSTTTPASAAQGAGSVPYLVVGVSVLMPILMVLLTLMSKMMMKQLKQEDAREDVEYDNIRLEEEQRVRQPARGSTLYFSADPDSLYANYSYHQDTELAAVSGNNHSNDFSLNSASSSAIYSKVARAQSRTTDLQCDLVYSVAQLPKEQIEPTGQSEPIHSESNKNDCLYSLAQLPRTA
ncbi:CMRF35-like molecule 5 [Chaetodon trifascialis]|uniref:CMRF35-like molecule 5 n=1 Tax=Chaetodon trifascialis TaxID=109706 RepID=UPI0039931DB8